MFYWKRITIGRYEARRNGEVVATAERIKNTGEPIWELTILDGTDYPTSSTGRMMDKFPTLDRARFAYGHAYRMAHEEA
jgi:hypothetical protein